MQKDKKYHMMLVDQMNQLWKFTNDPVFLKYYTKWNKPLQQPYVYRIFRQRNRSGIVLYFLISLIFMMVITIGWKLLSRLPGYK